jgi:dipeptidyl-peptidase-4
MAIVKSLMEQNRDFELLVIPNGGHDIVASPYVLRRTWDYFVRHLLGIDPPPTYLIKGPGVN